MNLRCALATLIALFFCSTVNADTPATIVQPGAQLVVAIRGLAFAEGPANDGTGAVYFTDQPNDKIIRWDPSGQVTTFLTPSGRSNGLCFGPDGGLWACADNLNELWKIDKRGHHVVIAQLYNGKLLNGPNDVWVRPDGGVYITDPYYRRSYWARGPKEQDTEGVYYIAAIPAKGRAHSETQYGPLQLVVSDMREPNGIIGTPDGKTLYVSDIGAGQTFAYDIQPDGSLTGKRLFCKMGSDGMTIDNAGNVYLTGNGVTVFDPTGIQIDLIAIPQPWTGNICFAGKDAHTLFITASTAVYTLQMKVHGVGSQ